MTRRELDLLQETHDTVIALKQEFKDHLKSCADVEERHEKEKSRQVSRMEGTAAWLSIAVTFGLALWDRVTHR